jgi:hypothetical protein
MKPATDKEMRVILARLRVVCEEVGDCPVAKARQPSQLDCFSCLINDMNTMTDELVELRKFKAQATQYGTRTTKLMAVFHPEVIDQLKQEITESEKKKGDLISKK